jgi:hypothetical protein
MMFHTQSASQAWALAVMVLAALQASCASGGTTVGTQSSDGSVKTEDSKPVPYWFEAYNLLDPAQILVFVGAQLAPANLNNTFPITLLPRLNPLDPKYVLKRCERADVSKCLRYGEPLLNAPRVNFLRIIGWYAFQASKPLSAPFSAATFLAH